MSTDPTFRMTIGDVFFVDGLGTVAAGHIEMGTINLYDDVWLHRGDGAMKTGIAAINVGAKRVKTAKAGDTVGVVLRGVPVDKVQPGNYLSASES